MLCTPASSNSFPLICLSVSLPACLFLVINNILSSTQWKHAWDIHTSTPGRRGGGEGQQGVNFCYYFSFDENMYIVQNIYMKYKLYMVWEAGMWWSLTTKRNVTLVLQFLLFHDMLLWTANKRPEFKLFFLFIYLEIRHNMQQHRWKQAVLVGDNFILLQGHCSFPWIKCDKSGHRPAAGCFIDPFTSTQQMTQGTKSHDSSLTKPDEEIQGHKASGGEFGSGSYFGGIPFFFCLHRNTLHQPRNWITPLWENYTMNIAMQVQK